MYNEVKSVVLLVMAIIQGKLTRKVGHAVVALHCTQAAASVLQALTAC